MSQSRQLSVACPPIALDSLGFPLISPDDGDISNNISNNITNKGRQALPPLPPSSTRRQRPSSSSSQAANNDNNTARDKFLTLDCGVKVRVFDPDNYVESDVSSQSSYASAEQSHLQQQQQEHASNNSNDVKNDAKFPPVYRAYHPDPPTPCAESPARSAPAVLLLEPEQPSQPAATTPSASAAASDVTPRSTSRSRSGSSPTPPPATPIAAASHTASTSAKACTKSKEHEDATGSRSGSLPRPSLATSASASADHGTTPQQHHSSSASNRSNSPTPTHSKTTTTITTARHGRPSSADGLDVLPQDPEIDARTDSPPHMRADVDMADNNDSHTGEEDANLNLAPQDFALVYDNESSASPPPSASASAARVSRRRSIRVSHAASSSRRISYDAGIQPGPFVPDRDLYADDVEDVDFCRSQSRRDRNRTRNLQRPRRTNSSSYAVMMDDEMYYHDQHHSMRPVHDVREEGEIVEEEEEGQRHSGRRPVPSDEAQDTSLDSRPSPVAFQEELSYPQVGNAHQTDHSLDQPQRDVIEEEVDVAVSSEVFQRNSDTDATVNDKQASAQGSAPTSSHTHVDRAHTDGRKVRRRSIATSTPTQAQQEQDDQEDRLQGFENEDEQSREIPQPAPGGCPTTTTTVARHQQGVIGSGTADNTWPVVDVDDASTPKTPTPTAVDLTSGPPAAATATANLPPLPPRHSSAQSRHSGDHLSDSSGFVVIGRTARGAHICDMNRGDQTFLLFIDLEPVDTIHSSGVQCHPDDILFEMDRAFSAPESRSIGIQTGVDGFPTPYRCTRPLVASTLGPIDDSDTGTDFASGDRTEAVPPYIQDVGNGANINKSRINDDDGNNNSNIDVGSKGIQDVTEADENDDDETYAPKENEDGGEAAISQEADVVMEEDIDARAQELEEAEDVDGDMQDVHLDGAVDDASAVRDEELKKIVDKVTSQEEISAVDSDDDDRIVNDQGNAVNNHSVDTPAVASAVAPPESAGPVVSTTDNTDDVQCISGDGVQKEAAVENGPPAQAAVGESDRKADDSNSREESQHCGNSIVPQILMGHRFSPRRSPDPKPLMAVVYTKKPRSGVSLDFASVWTAGISINPNAPSKSSSPSQSRSESESEMQSPDVLPLSQPSSCYNEIGIAHKLTSGVSVNPTPQVVDGRDHDAIEQSLGDKNVADSSNPISMVQDESSIAANNPVARSVKDCPSSDKSIGNSMKGSSSTESADEVGHQDQATSKVNVQQNGTQRAGLVVESPVVTSLHGQVTDNVPMQQTSEPITEKHATPVVSTGFIQDQAKKTSAVRTSAGSMSSRKRRVSFSVRTGSKLRGSGETVVAVVKSAAVRSRPSSSLSHHPAPVQKTPASPTTHSASERADVNLTAVNIQTTLGVTQPVNAENSLDVAHSSANQDSEMSKDRCGSHSEDTDNVITLEVDANSVVESTNPTRDSNDDDIVLVDADVDDVPEIGKCSAMSNTTSNGDQNVQENAALEAKQDDDNTDGSIKKTVRFTPRSIKTAIQTCSPERRVAIYKTFLQCLVQPKTLDSVLSHAINPNNVDTNPADNSGGNDGVINQASERRMSRRIFNGTSNGEQGKPETTTAEADQVQENTVEGQEPVSVDAEGIDVDDVEEEESNDDIAAESGEQDFGTIFEREAHEGQKISLDDLDISEERRDSSVDVYFQEPDARYERRHSDTDPVEVIEPGDDAVVSCLSPNVVAEVVDSTIVEPCGEIGEIIVEPNNPDNNEPNNETAAAATAAVAAAAAAFAAAAADGTNPTGAAGAATATDDTKSPDAAAASAADGPNSAVAVDSVLDDVNVNVDTDNASNGKQNTRPADVVEEQNVVIDEKNGADKKIERSKKRGPPRTSVARQQWHRQGHVSTQRLATATGSISRTINFDDDDHDDDQFFADGCMKIPTPIGFKRSQVHSQINLSQGANPSSSPPLLTSELKTIRRSTRLSRTKPMTGNLNERSLEGRIQKPLHPLSSTTRSSSKSRARSVDINPQTEAQKYTSTSDDLDDGKMPANKEKDSRRNVQSKGSGEARVEGQDDHLSHEASDSYSRRRRSARLKDVTLISYREKKAYANSHVDVEDRQLAEEDEIQPVTSIKQASMDKRRSADSSKLQVQETFTRSRSNSNIAETAAIQKRSGDSRNSSNGRVVADASKNAILPRQTRSRSSGAVGKQVIEDEIQPIRKVATNSKKNAAHSSENDNVEAAVAQPRQKSNVSEHYRRSSRSRHSNGRVEHERQQSKTAKDKASAVKKSEGGHQGISMRRTSEGESNKATIAKRLKVSSTKMSKENETNINDNENTNVADDERPGTVEIIDLTLDVSNDINQGNKTAAKGREDKTVVVTAQTQTRTQKRHTVPFVAPTQRRQSRRLSNIEHVKRRQMSYDEVKHTTPESPRVEARRPPSEPESGLNALPSYIKDAHAAEETSAAVLSPGADLNVSGAIDDDDMIRPVVFEPSLGEFDDDNDDDNDNDYVNDGVDDDDEIVPFRREGGGATAASISNGMAVSVADEETEDERIGGGGAVKRRSTRTSSQLLGHLDVHPPLNYVRPVSGVSIQPLGTNNIINNARSASMKVPSTTASTVTTTTQGGRTTKRKRKRLNNDSRHGGVLKRAKTKYGPIQLQAVGMEHVNNGNVSTKRTRETAVEALSVVDPPRRSGRQRLPPLKFWKNEVVRYHRRTSQVMPTVAEVVVDMGSAKSLDDSWIGGRR